MTERDKHIEMAQRLGLVGMRPHLDGIYIDALAAFAKLVADDACATPALPQGVEEWMPILGTCLAIPMKLLDESQAKSNHGQTPARLKERGGISLSEAVAIAGKMKWRSLESKRALEILHDLSGMAIVPVEPTLKMIEAAIYHAMRETDEDKYRAIGMIRCVWDEMLAAAKEKGYV